MNETGSTRMELLAQITQIEADLDAGRYRPGPWSRAIAAIRATPQPVRESLSADLSRVSRKLHMRGGRATMGVAAAMTLEACALAASCILIGVGRAASSNLLALCGTAIAISALQPIVKVAVGRVLGVDYEYAYLSGVEPRFKMAYGTYVARLRWARIALHLSGAAGSPIAAFAGALFTRGPLPLASAISWDAGWVIVAINLVSLAAGLTGIARLGPLRTADASCGVAGTEIREALAISPRA